MIAWTVLFFCIQENEFQLVHQISIQNPKIWQHPKQGHTASPVNFHNPTECDRCLELTNKSSPPNNLLKMTLRWCHCKWQSSLSYIHITRHSLHLLRELQWSSQLWVPASIGLSEEEPHLTKSGWCKNSTSAESAQNIYSTQMQL